MSEKKPHRMKAAAGVRMDTAAVLRGRVVDFETAQPLPGAAVMLEGGGGAVAGAGTGVLTDAKGYYELKGLTGGSYTLIVSYVGYQRNELRNVTVEAGKAAIFDVKMLAGKGLGAGGVTNGARKGKGGA